MRVCVCFLFGDIMNDKIIKKLSKLFDKSYKKNEFPVSAVIYDSDHIISCGYNKRNRSKKTTDHAEIIAIERANRKLKSWNLQGLKMIVTLEPCEMCKNVIREARISEVYYLVEKLDYKKQYDKTIFKMLNDGSIKKEKYTEKMGLFFKDKR